MDGVAAVDQPVHASDHLRRIAERATPVIAHDLSTNISVLRVDAELELVATPTP
jgi:hypothetical protein